MPRPAFRLAKSPDAYPIALMSRELIETGLSGWSWPPERVARSIQARDTVVLVAAVQNHVIGFAIMNFGDAQAHLSLLAVQSSYQRCGIGRQMMEWLEESALVAGIATVNLELRANNHTARDFYRVLGFKEAAYIPGYYHGVETALRMSRDIRRRIPGHIGWSPVSLPSVSESRNRRR
jgi:ribosomal-protein-alanine N-acetyltransferase